MLALLVVKCKTSYDLRIILYGNFYSKGFCCWWSGRSKVIEMFFMKPI